MLDGERYYLAVRTERAYGDTYLAVIHGTEAEAAAWLEATARLDRPKEQNWMIRYRSAYAPYDETAYVLVAFDGIVELPSGAAQVFIGTRDGYIHA